MIRVWFNHWFSTSYYIIKLMKENADDSVTVIGSNRRMNSVIKKVCDEWYEEPELDGDDYIEYCIDFCRKHSVDVFVPRRNMVEISRHVLRFREIGVRVMVDDYSKISILNHKADTYHLFKREPEIYVPEFEVVKSTEAFLAAYKRLNAKYEKLCIKFVNDEGGMSFRRIEESMNHFEELSKYPDARISLQDVTEALNERQHFKELMVMPYLSGEEISVDCLKTDLGLIAVPRFKGDFRDERIIFDKNIIRMCEIILEMVSLECPCNIQFKMSDGIPYLLEINTRMSGGVQMSCLAAEVNIPNIALNKLLGKTIPWTLNQHDCVVSFIEIPQIIE